MTKVTAPNLLGLYATTTARVFPNLWYIYTALVSDSLYATTSVSQAARSAGELLSELTPESFCSGLNLSKEQALDIFATLQRINWVEDVRGFYKVGTISEGTCQLLAKSTSRNVPKEAKVTTLSQARQYLERQKELLRTRRSVEAITRVSPDVRKATLVDFSAKTTAGSPAGRLLPVLKESHAKYIGGVYPMARNTRNGGYSYSKECGFINRFVGYCDNNEELARKLVIWTMQNWKKVQEDLQWVGCCDMAFFITRHCFTRIREMYGCDKVEGFVASTNTADRYNEHNAKNAPSEGFGV